MTYKGNYSAETSYNVDDVVCFGGEWFIMLKAAAAGTPCTNTLYWSRASRVVSIVSKLVSDAITAITDAMTDAISTAVGAIPTAEVPEADGAYTFTATVDDGEVTYSWEAPEAPAGEET